MEVLVWQGAVEQDPALRVELKRLMTSSWLTSHYDKFFL